jgi:hypothetical protein
MLGRLLSNAVNDNSNQDVHDRALLYYRLLMSDVDSAEKLFSNANCDLLQNRIASGGSFAENSNENLLDDLFKEFNTLAVIYGKPSTAFIKEEFLLKLRDSSALRDARFEAVTNAVQHGLDDLSLAPQSTQVTSQTHDSVDLLDFGNDNAHTITSAPVIQSTSKLSLDSSVALSPPEFQQQWGAFAEAQLPNNSLLCCLAALPDEQAEVEESMADVNIRTMASGPTPTGMKLFLYALTAGDMLMGTGGDLFLIQLLIESSSGNVSVNIKGSNCDPQLVTQLMITLKQGLAPFSPN